MIAPRYQDIRGGQVTLLTSPDGGALLRLIAGEIAGHTGPGHAHPDHAGARHGAPGRAGPAAVAADFNALAYVLAGRGTVGPRAPGRLGQLAVFGAGDSSPDRRARAGLAAARRWRCCCSAASRSASPSPPTARS